jgi:hypothetical protein
MYGWLEEHASLAASGAALVMFLFWVRLLHASDVLQLLAGLALAAATYGLVSLRLEGRRKLHLPAPRRVGSEGRPISQ